MSSGQVSREGKHTPAGLLAGDLMAHVSPVSVMKKKFEKEAMESES